ncbi:MAG: nicotinate (nicotinamide) nucleotide adenylyltransferase [Ignavibacteriales bacterium]|nr:MAG: nicotinate (nicotinamide) nucleotide adenylyltransferase [Ignavibacteriales bacterium]
MSVIGVYGGTFDPVHLGHLITAQFVYEVRNLSKIIFVPNLISPHKTGKKISSAQHRLEMLRLAVNGIKHFEVSEIELNRSGISYTIDTIRELKRSTNIIEMIIGYDNLIEFSTWKDPDEILNLAKLVVMDRKIKSHPLNPDKYFSNAVLLDTPQIEISASEIRDRVKKNLPINFLVPQKVMEYISAQNLYKE